MQQDWLTDFALYQQFYLVMGNSLCACPSVFCKYHPIFWFMGYIDSGTAYHYYRSWE
jgi:hypothetical protein